MSSAVDSVVKVASFGLLDDTADLVKVGTLGAIDLGVDDTTEDTSEEDAQEQAQEDATNAARASQAAKKKSSTTQTVLTSPLGATTTAKTAVTKLGGM